MNSRINKIVILLGLFCPTLAFGTIVLDKVGINGELLDARIIEDSEIHPVGSQFRPILGFETDSLLVPLHISGPSDALVDIIIYPGYQYFDWGPGSAFAATTDEVLNEILSFPQIQANGHRINIFRIDGRNLDDDCYLVTGSPVCDRQEILNYVSEHFSGFDLEGDDQIVVVFNTTHDDMRFARAEFEWNMVFLMSWYPPLVVHELGHSFGKLGDEYDRTFAQPSDPKYANVASMTPGYTCEEKWGHLMYLPEVGCFQNSGGTNWYRSTYDLCVMRYSNKMEWCPICSEVIQARFDSHFVSGVHESSIAAGGGVNLFEAAPNPFNPQTTIAYDLPKQMAVSLRVYDVSGRLVDVLLDNEIAAQGRNEVVWRGRDMAGRSVSAGVYFYRLKAGSYSETKRMVLVK